jgi:hypothetical protein
VFGKLASAPADYRPAWLKQAIDGYSFVTTEEYDKFTSYENNKSHFEFMVGHNRAATAGAVTTENAHPFQEGPITMVHNGSLFNTQGLPNPQHTLDGVQVDSHVICHNLARHGVEEVVRNIDGSFTLVWHDSRDDTLNIVRNTERPLHLAQVKGEQTLLFMSEAEMLHLVCTRLGIAINDIWYPQAGKWLKFRNNDLMNPEVKELELQPTYSHYGNSCKSASAWGDYCDTDGWDTYDKSVPGVTKSDEKKQDNRVNVLGKKRTIPEKLQETLLEADMVIEDRIDFIPSGASVPPGRSRAIVSGYNPVTNTTCLLYDQDMRVYDNFKNNV